MTDTKADPTVTDPGTGPADDADTGTDDKGTGTDTGTDSDNEGDEEDEDPPSSEAYKKLEEKAKRREEALRKAQRELKELRAKADGTDKDEDPETRANQKLVRASAKTVLAGIGVTDRADQAAVLEIIRLDDIEVDDAGDPDEDEISDRVERLRKALGVKAGKEQRTPRRQTSDRGGNGGGTDPDSARYRAFLNQ
jgi:hypothetical protein